MFGVASVYSGLLLAQCVWSQSEEQLQREVESPLNCVDSERSQNGDTILVTYTGYLANGTKFDSNEGGDPLTFVLGEGRVIQGWEKGLVNTCAGEKVVMIIPPSLGYGSRGAGGVIPGGATLYFIATLNGIVRKTKEAPNNTEVKQDGECKDLKTVGLKDRVVMRSRVSLLSTGQVQGELIDASTDTVEVGTGQVVKGWDAGVLGACEGEERRIVLGPSLAFGARGLPGKVPGDATIVIDVVIETVERDLVFNFLEQISSGNFRRG